MNDLTKTFICPRCSFPTQRLYEHLHKCVEFYYTYIYIDRWVMSDISSHDSISMIFSFSLLKTWHCVEHLMGGITNLFFYVEQKDKLRTWVFYHWIINRKRKILHRYYSRFLSGLIEEVIRFSRSIRKLLEKKNL